MERFSVAKGQIFYGFLSVTSFFYDSLGFMSTLKSSKVSRERAYVVQMLGPGNTGKVFCLTEDDQIYDSLVFLVDFLRLTSMILMRKS